MFFDNGMQVYRPLWIIGREVVLDRFAAGWEELDDPRTGNAGLHDFIELLMIALR